MFGGASIKDLHERYLPPPVVSLTSLQPSLSSLLPHLSLPLSPPPSFSLLPPSLSPSLPPSLVLPPPSLSLSLPLQFASKQMGRSAKKCEKEEKTEKLKLKKALQKGNVEGARIHAENAIRQKNQV